MECLVAGGLQVEQGEFVVGAVLGFMADGLKQCRCSVELRVNDNSQKTATYITLVFSLDDCRVSIL